MRVAMCSILTVCSEATYTASFCFAVARRSEFDYTIDCKLVYGSEEEMSCVKTAEGIIVSYIMYRPYNGR